MGEGEGGEFPPKKSQSETQTTAADFPAKKLARQLDFTAGFGGTVVLPDHPQSVPQPRPPPPPQPPVPPPPTAQTSLRVL